MTYKITHKNSTVAGTPPVAGDIDVGEIAINAADAELYTKDANGNIKKFANTDTTGAAAGVQFTQTGTGAVQRTVESKLQDVVSVKDFGAVGDGVADDTAEIQAALNANQHVIIPVGQYSVTTLSIPANRTLTINGELINSGTITVAGNNVSICGSGKITSSATGSVIYADSRSRFIYEGVLLDGTGAGYGINLIGCTNYTVRSCEIRKANTLIHLDFSNNGIITGVRMYGKGYSQTGSQNHGIQWWGGDPSGGDPGTRVKNIVISNCYGEDFSGAAIWGASGENIAVTGCVVRNCKDIGIDFEFCHNSVMSGNSVELCAAACYALFLGCTSCSITGNVGDNTGQSLESGLGKYVCWLTGHANDKNTISGNTFTTDGSEIMRVSAPSKYNLISGNSFNTSSGSALVHNYNADYNIYSNNRFEQVRFKNSGGLRLVFNDNYLRNTTAGTTSVPICHNYWVDSTYTAKECTYNRNTVLAGGVAIYDDCWGDNTSYFCCQSNFIADASGLKRQGSSGGSLFSGNLELYRPTSSVSVGTV
jgi:hypothetical protein